MRRPNSPSFRSGHHYSVGHSTLRDWMDGWRRRGTQIASCTISLIPMINLTRRTAPGSLRLVCLAERVFHQMELHALPEKVGKFPTFTSTCVVPRKRKSTEFHILDFYHSFITFTTKIILQSSLHPLLSSLFQSLLECNNVYITHKITTL